MYTEGEPRIGYIVPAFLYAMYIILLYIYDVNSSGRSNIIIIFRFQTLSRGSSGAAVQRAVGPLYVVRGWLWLGWRHNLQRAPLHNNNNYIGTGAWFSIHLHFFSFFFHFGLIKTRQVGEMGVGRSTDCSAVLRIALASRLRYFPSFCGLQLCIFNDI